MPCRRGGEGGGALPRLQPGSGLAFAALPSSSWRKSTVRWGRAVGQAKIGVL